MLQCVAVRCSVLQCVAVCCGASHTSKEGVGGYSDTVCCSALQCVAVCCSALQRVAVLCIAVTRKWGVVVTRCVAVCCSVLQCVAVCCSVLQCLAVCCSVLQCVAACCSVLQFVAVCCSALHTFKEGVGGDGERPGKTAHEIEKSSKVVDPFVGVYALVAQPVRTPPGGRQREKEERYMYICIERAQQQGSRSICKGTRGRRAAGMDTTWRKTEREGERERERYI